MPWERDEDPSEYEGRIVPGYGPPFAKWAIVGEGPGLQEAKQGQPFVGPTGTLQANLLGRGGLHASQFYRTNVNKRYHVGDPDPSPEEIAEFTPILEQELASRPQLKVIIAVGAFATRWFLGPDTVIDSVRGYPQRSARTRAIVIPVTHPAAGFHDDKYRSLIHADYARACRILTGDLPAVPVEDEHAGVEDYRDLTGAEVAEILESVAGAGLDLPIALDTEGVPGREWSIQFSVAPGTGYTLRRSQPDFDIGAKALLGYCLTEPRPLTVMHNAMYDLQMARLMGVDLFDCRLWDTRYAAYLLRTEPQGLKSLCKRWCGMAQPDYADLVDPVSVQMQLDWLEMVADETRSWPKPEKRSEYNNNGEWESYQPQPIHKRAEAILIDYLSDKLDKEGNLPDPYKRWQKCDAQLRRQVEAQFGRMPIATLADIDLDVAIRYASRDPDATLRLYHALAPAIAERDLDSLMEAGCDTLPLFEEMQSAGMQFDRGYCEDRSMEMWAKMDEICAYIRERYWSGQPFNPASPVQVTQLMTQQGLSGAKISKKTKRVSTAKKSIEHFRYDNDAMAAVIDWREHQKMRDAFYQPIIERLGDRKFGAIHSNINPYSVATRRISSSNPNLTAIPVRNELGVAVRKGCRAKPGYYYGSWDMSQIEMRYMAHESRDERLCAFMREGKDAHSEVAGAIFRLNLPDTDDLKLRYAGVDEKRHRYPAKRAGFGIITSISGAGLLDQLRMFGCTGWTVDKCDELIEDWLSFYSGVRRYMAACKQEARRHGYVRDHWGMYRHLEGIWMDGKASRHIKAEAERAASSHKISAGAQGMLQNAMRWLKGPIRDLRKMGVDVTWSLQVHDELIFHVPEDYIEYVDALVREALTEHLGIQLCVPVKCSGAWARTWGELK